MRFGRLRAALKSPSLPTDCKNERSLLADHPALHHRGSAAERPVFLSAVRPGWVAGARTALATAERAPVAVAAARASHGLSRRTPDCRAGAGERWAAAAALAGAQREPAASTAQPAYDPRGAVA